MAIYVIGDIHGHVDILKKLINKLNLNPNDHLIFLGDYIDRGPDASGVIKYIQCLKKTYKVTTLIGNHEMMMIESIDILNKPEDITQNETDFVSNWLSENNGGYVTFNDMYLTDKSEEEAKIISDFFSELISDTSVIINGKHYTLCHSFPLDVIYNSISDSEIPWEAAWARVTSDNNGNINGVTGPIDIKLLKDNYANKIIIHGHTPVMNLDQCNVGEVLNYQIKGVTFINIDIGCAYLDHTDDYKNHNSTNDLCAFRLDDEKEFYAFK